MKKTKKILTKITKQEAENFKKLHYTKDVILDLLEEMGLRRKILLDTIRKKYSLSEGFSVNHEKKIITEL